MFSMQKISHISGFCIVESELGVIWMTRPKKIRILPLAKLPFPFPWGKWVHSASKTLGKIIARVFEASNPKKYPFSGQVS